jgi:hypothetical protein
VELHLKAFTASTWLTLTKSLTLTTPVTTAEIEVAEVAEAAVDEVDAEVVAEVEDLRRYLVLNQLNLSTLFAGLVAKRAIDLTSAQARLKTSIRQFTSLTRRLHLCFTPLFKTFAPRQMTLTPPTFLGQVPSRQSYCPPQLVFLTAVLTRWHSDSILSPVYI